MIISIPIIIMILENSVDCLIIAVLLIFIILDVVLYKAITIPMIVFWIFVATMIVAYISVVFGIVDFSKWSLVRDALLGLIMASSLNYIRLSNLKNITIREIVVALISVVIIVILGKLTGKLAGVAPPMSVSEILLRMGHAMTSPFLETIMFSIFMLYYYGGTVKGCILTIIMSVIFAFFHTRFTDLWFSLYFIGTNILLAIAFYLTKNVSLTIIIHYAVNVYLYGEMIAMGLMQKIR